MPVSRRALIAAIPALLLPRAAPAALAPTPPATEGPFYPRKLPAEDDSDLVRIEAALREAGGEVLHLRGSVLDLNGAALAAMRVEIWQCDANGVYLHPGSRGAGNRDAAFQGFGHAISGADGAFAFRTIVPVPYPGRTPHIHMKVLRDGRTLLTTQFYRAGFPQNASDGQFRRLTSAEQQRVSMVLSPRAAAARPTYDTEIEVVVGG